MIKPIPSCPGYFVTETGEIYNQYGRRLRPGKTSRGYLLFVANNKGHRRSTYVHHAVAEAYLGPRPPGAQVLHANDVKTDNRIENLRYGTHFDNVQDAQRNGRYLVGGRNPAAKLTGAQVTEIRQRRNNGESLLRLGQEFGISVSYTAQLCRGERWKELV